MDRFLNCFLNFIIQPYTIGYCKIRSMFSKLLRSYLCFIGNSEILDMIDVIFKSDLPSSSRIYKYHQDLQ